MIVDLIAGEEGVAFRYRFAGKSGRLHGREFLRRRRLPVVCLLPRGLCNRAAPYLLSGAGEEGGVRRFVGRKEIECDLATALPTSIDQSLA